MMGTHQVHVRLAQRDRSTLLSLVSTLHRRGVEVLAAEFGPTRGEAYGFNVTFLATARQAATVSASLRSLVDVLDAEPVLFPRGREFAHARPSLPQARIHDSNDLATDW